MKRSMAILAVCVVLSCCAPIALGQAQQPTAAEKQSATTIVLPPSPKTLLPDAFDGWIEEGTPKVFTDAAQADPTNAAALKEYGFNAGIEAQYKRDGDTLSLRALRFEDVSGAYGAYSYYRQSGWPKQEIGSGAASNKNRVIFWQGITVVDAAYSRIGPMTPGELREIAHQLPVPSGNRAMIPPILQNLPQAKLDAQTTHYAEGAAGYAGSGGVLPPALVGFDKGAEAVTASYSLPSNQATLTIIDYPTPQIAEAQEAAIRAYLKAGGQAQPPFPKPLMDSDQASIEVRHSGPLVILVSGDAIPEESHKLLETVHYASSMTDIPQPMESEIQKTSQLLMGIAGITIVGALAAILLGGFLGGGRALYRMATGKPISTVFDEEFIHLDLREKWVDRDEAIEGPHPKG